MKKFIKTAVFMLLICTVIAVWLPVESKAAMGDNYVYEDQSNVSYGTAQHLPSGATVRGYVNCYDFSFYYFNIEKLSTLEITAETDLADVIVAISNSDQEIIAAELTTIDSNGNYSTHFTFEVGPGTYYLVMLQDFFHPSYYKTYLEITEVVNHSHNYDYCTTTVVGTCTEPGYITHTCICGDSYTETEIYAEHIESDWIEVDEATCTTEGYRYKECTVCHTKLEEENYYGKHDFADSEWVLYKKPTSTESGSFAKFCNQCKEVVQTIPVTFGFNNVDGKDIYITESGEIGYDLWIFDEGYWFYLDSNGNITTNRWMQDSIGWVYLNAFGRMETNAWVPDSVGMCYVGENGYCKTDCWVQDSNGWCYVDANGRKAINRWVQDTAGWCYVGADGYCVTDCWMQDSIGWCYLDSNGRMVTNAWVQDSNGWCYIGEYGYALSNTWKEDSSGWCYLGSNGSMLKDSWLNEGGNWYYLNGSGHMVTGWLNSYGTWYFFGEDGIMWAGCYGEIDGSIYYFYDNGAMLANENYGSSYVESDGVIWDGCFAYLAGADFRSERRDFPSTHALGGYVHAYINNQGEVCVLTIIFYKIGGYNYNITTLHNLTTGRTIEEPYDYYDKMADRYYGNTKLAYLKLALEVSEESLYALNYGAYLTSEYLEY